MIRKISQTTYRSDTPTQIHTTFTDKHYTPAATSGFMPSRGLGHAATATKTASPFLLPIT